MCCSVVCVSPQHSTMIVCVCVCVCVFVHVHATHGNTLHCTATHCNSTPVLTHPSAHFSHTQVLSPQVCVYMHTCVQTHCNTLHYTATHCTTLQHTAKRCQHTATHCNKLQHSETNSEVRLRRTQGPIFPSTRKHTFFVFSNRKKRALACVEFESLVKK